MCAFSPVQRLLRGLMAAMLLLGLWANTASAEMPTSIAPEWLAAAICHADPGSNAPSPTQAVLHRHCVWCRSAAALALPPVPAAVAQPALIGIAALTDFTPSDPAARPLFAHAPRGPPVVG